MIIVPHTVLSLIALLLQTRATATLPPDANLSSGGPEEPVRPVESGRLQQVEHLILGGELLFSLGHEVRNTLWGMIGNVQLLQYEPLPPKARELVQEVVAAGQQLQDLIQSMLGITPQSAAARCYVDDVLTHVVRLAGPIAREYQATIQYTPARHNQVALAPHVLQQVILNLVLNSAQAVRDAHGHIWLTTAQDADQVRITVRDDGPGIPAAVLPHIFEPFFTTKAANMGTGLGLSIARNLVRQANGELNVIDAQPGNTTFEVRLPTIGS